MLLLHSAPFTLFFASSSAAPVFPNCPAHPATQAARPAVPTHLPSGLIASAWPIDIPSPRQKLLAAHPHFDDEYVPY